MLRTNIGNCSRLDLGSGSKAQPRGSDAAFTSECAARSR